MQKTALVTGTYGFLGRHVAKKLACDGWQVTGIGHGSWNKKEWSQYGIKVFFNCDVTYENLEKVLNPPFNIVIHCAGTGSVGASYSNPREDFRKNVISSHDLLEYLRIHSPSSHLIFPSSASVYGCVEKKLIPEEHPRNPVSPYGLHKKMVEDLCEFYSSRHDINVDIIRFFSIYGTGLKKQLIWDACKKIHAGNSQFFGTGNEIRDFLHIDDAVSLIQLLAEKPSQGLSIINGGTGLGITTREIITLIQKGFSDNNPLNFTNLIREGDPTYMIADIRKARSLGWIPLVPLNVGINDTIEWFYSIM